jgi:predicted ester cyclase
MSKEANMALVRTVMEAVNRQDLKTLRAHPGYYETVQSIPVMWAAFPDMHHTIEQQFADGDWVATCVTVRGTHRGAFMGVAPTGKEISFIVLMMNRIEDGKIVLHYGLPDFMAIFQPLGLIPAWAA